MVRSVVVVKASCALLGMVLPISAAAAVKAGKYPRVYKGDEGLTVTVIRLADPHSKEALVEVKGIESRFDDVVLHHREVVDGKRTALETYVDDDTFWTLTSNETWYGGKRLDLRLPEDRRKTKGLWYDEKESKKADGEALVKKYEKQLADGTIQKIQVYGGSDFKAHTNGTFKRAVDDIEDGCGGGIGAKIDWDSVKKSAYGKVALATLCRQPVAALGALCSDRPDDKFSKKISGITCRVGSSQSLKLGGDKRLMWSVRADKPVDHDAMLEQLQKIFK